MLPANDATNAKLVIILWIQTIQTGVQNATAILLVRCQASTHLAIHTLVNAIASQIHKVCYKSLLAQTGKKTDMFD